MVEPSGFKGNRAAFSYPNFNDKKQSANRLRTDRRKQRNFLRKTAKTQPEPLVFSRFLNFFAARNPHKQRDAEQNEEKAQKV